MISYIALHANIILDSRARGAILITATIKVGYALVQKNIERQVKLRSTPVTYLYYAQKKGIL